jgi:nickel superoxide dismutase
MRRNALPLLLAVIALTPVRFAAAHCEVPCGIYADQARFEKMLENTDTIAKADTSINEFATGEHDATAINQVSRWVTTKEDHATDTQHIIAQYFMTQRIKSDDPKYTEKLTAAHAVMVGAMKCKQDANPETAAALRQAILTFYTAYTGKAPSTVHTHE